MQQPVGAEQQADEHEGEIAVVVVGRAPIGRAIENAGELVHDLGVERRQAAAELRPAQGGDADLAEKNTARAIRGKLEEQEVEGACQRALGIEHVELGLERTPHVLHHLVDGGDQQIFFGDEIVVDESGG